MTGVTRTSVGWELSNVDVQPPQDAVRSIRVKNSWGIFFFFFPRTFLESVTRGINCRPLSRFKNSFSITSASRASVSSSFPVYWGHWRPSCLRGGRGGSHDGSSCPNAVRVTLITDARRTLPSCIMGQRAAAWPFCLSVQCGKSRISWSTTSGENTSEAPPPGHVAAAAQSSHKSFYPERKFLTQLNRGGGRGRGE